MRMTRQAYMDRVDDPSWAPGWEAILEAFAKVYETPVHYLPAGQFPHLRSKLEGFGVFYSPKPYLHIVTRGLSRIYPHPEAYGCSTSGWGFELTVKWPGERWTECLDAFRLLDRLAERVEVLKIGFSPMKCLWRGRDPLSEEAFSKYGASLMMLPDTEVEAKETVHGDLLFLQLVNISAEDAKKLSLVPSRIYRLFENAKKEDQSVCFHIPSPRNYLSA